MSNSRTHRLTGIGLLAIALVGIPTLADTTLRDDLVIGFEQPFGTYQRFDDLAWSLLHPFTPVEIVSADLNLTGRSELIIDFGNPYGMWVRRDDTDWVPFHPASPDQYIVADLDFNGRDEVIADFGSFGVWIRYNDTNWVLLDSRNPTLIASAQLDDDLRDDVIVALPGVGTWVYANNSEWWELHSGIPQIVEAGRFCGDRDGLVVDFPSPFGIYLYCSDWVFWQVWPSPFEWLQLHPGNAEEIVTGQLDQEGSPDEVVFDFGPGGTWILLNTQPNVGWSYLHPFSPRHMTVADLDSAGGGDIVFDFQGAGIWAYYNLSDWQQKNPNSAEVLATANTNRPLYTCLDLLAAGMIIEADDCLDDRLTLDPNDLDAHLFKAVTMVIRVFTEEPEVAAPFGLQNNGGLDLGLDVETFQTLLDAFGAGGEDRNPLNFTADFPEPLPEGSPEGGDVQTLLRDQIIEALDSAIDDHLSLLDPGFETILDDADLTEIDQPVDIDYADAKLLEAALQAWKAVFLKALIAQDLDVDIDAFSQQAYLGIPFQLQAHLLSPYPSFLTSVPGAATDLADSKAALQTAFECYYDASDFIRNEDDPNQLDDLVTIEFDPISLMEEEQLRREMGEIYCSLDGLGFVDLDEFGFPECGGAPLIDGETIDLSPLFDESNDFRGLLPTFAWDAICEDDYVDTSVVDADTPFPDPTLGGILPGLSQSELLDMLDIPGTVESAYHVQVFGPSGGVTQFYQGQVYQGDLSPQIAVTAIGYNPGTVFSLDPATLPTFPYPLCSYDFLAFGSFFSPPSDGAYQETVVVSTSIGSFASPVLGCTGSSYWDCNNDTFPDFSPRDLGVCGLDEQVIPSPGMGGILVDVCSGVPYTDMDPGEGDGLLDDCNCDGFEDYYPDRGKCVTGNGLLPSDGTGAGLVDPCSGMPYMDSATGFGDGRVDDCDCDGWPDP